MTAKAVRNNRSNTRVSLTLAAVAAQATGTPSPAMWYLVPRLPRSELVSFYQSGFQIHSMLCQMALHHLLCSRLVTHPDKNSQALSWVGPSQITTALGPH